MTGELAAKAPELIPPGNGAAPGVPFSGPVAEERPPAFTPESFKNSLKGAVALFCLLQGIPDDPEGRFNSRQMLLSDEACDRLAVRGVPLANKYELKATECLEFWNRWRDEILFAFDVSAVAVHCAREYRTWKKEQQFPPADDGMETRTGSPAS